MYSEIGRNLKSTLPTNFYSSKKHSFAAFENVPPTSIINYYFLTWPPSIRGKAKQIDNNSSQYAFRIIFTRDPLNLERYSHNVSNSFYLFISCNKKAWNSIPSCCFVHRKNCAFLARINRTNRYRRNRLTLCFLNGIFEKSIWFHNYGLIGIYDK